MLVIREVDHEIVIFLKTSEASAAPLSLLCQVQSSDLIKYYACNQTELTGEPTEWSP